jgi:TrmH family RNA methyltransferase
VRPLEHINIVLVRPQQAGNIGLAARAIANHGIGQLTLVSPAGFDPERARWMAPKSHHVINNARLCATVSEAVADAARVVATTARSRSRDWPIQTPEEFGPSVAEKRLPTAILFGPEDSGLSNDDLRFVESLLHFPTTDVRSLNLGQAVTATAAALSMGTRTAEPEPTIPTVASAGRREDLVQRTMSVLKTAGYMDGRSVFFVFNILARIAGRADLSDEEVNNLLGMVKQAQWWSTERSE